MKFGQKLSGNKANSQAPNTTNKSNPIANSTGMSPAIGPINPRKTANRLYGGYNQNNRFFGGLSTSDPVEMFYEFCSIAKNKNNVDEVFHTLHNIAISKLGYSFTAIGTVSNSSKCINIKLIDHIGNNFSSRIMLSEDKNPLIQAFNNEEIKNVANLDFLNMPYLKNYQGMIVPMKASNESVGVFIAGSNGMTQHDMNSLSVLVDYLTLFVKNKDLEDRFSQNKDTDALTNLKSHRAFQESLRLELSKAGENNKPLSVIILDINNISQINREFGHAKGDEIIKLVADKIKQNIRSTDIAGRYGGDEIAVILPDLDGAETSYIAEYLNYSLSCSMVDDVGPVKVSIGVASYPVCASDQEKLLILAEQAMMISKNKGYQNGMSSIVSAQDIDFWNDKSLDSFATVLAKRHSQLGVNFEEEIVSRFQNESIGSNGHMFDVVTSLAGAIDAKDTYTRGHSQSVARYAEVLARAINLPESEVERIRLGAMLHDVGKIGIPETILRKPNQLTDEEWEIMKQHPTIGAKKVLAPIESLRDLIPIIEHHHEHWDGSGYPAKLKGEEIPLGARIVAVADSFHALISDRPYRKGLGIDKAIDILRIGSGIQWDRDLVREFIILAPSLCTTV